MGKVDTQKWRVPTVKVLNSFGFAKTKKQMDGREEKEYAFLVVCNKMICNNLKQIVKI
jgi:hypothetical protein